MFMRCCNHTLPINPRSTYFQDTTPILRYPSCCGNSMLYNTADAPTRVVVGIPGPVGPQGPRGLTGPIGPTGATGPAGATGPTGATGPAGADGIDGVDGVSAGFGTPTATATTLPAGSDATVTVTATGDDTAKVFNFTFGIPQGATGATGAQGEQGIQGDTGAAAGFGTPTATITILPATETAYVNVTATGPDTAKVFNFDFGIPSAT